MAKYESRDIDQVIAVTKALSDANRLRAILMLTTGELCLCQIIEMLALAPSTVSKHMSVLRQAKLIETRKQGRWTYYRLADSDNNDHIHSIVKWARQSLLDDQHILDDAQRLEDVKQMDTEQLCQHYKKTTS